MVQEIKFKLWNGESLIKIDNLSFCGRFLIFLKLIFNSDNFILLQFTSLKDKNGQEIYNGDIILDTSSNAKFQVYWDDEQAGWEFKYLDIKNEVKNIKDFFKSWCLSLEDVSKDCTVVGNIFMESKWPRGT